MRADDYISSVVGPSIFFYPSHSYVGILFFLSVIALWFCIK